MVEVYAECSLNPHDVVRVPSNDQQRGAKTPLDYAIGLWMACDGHLATYFVEGASPASPSEEDLCRKVQAARSRRLTTHLGAGAWVGLRWWDGQTDCEFVVPRDS